MSIFAYARVSTKEQTTENQRRDIEAAGYQVEYWFVDEGVSGKVAAIQRPQFKAMLDKNRDGERLVVTKLDRLGRDAQDILATVKALEARRIEVIVLQLGKLDLASAAGKLMLTMLATVAEMERDLLVDRHSPDWPAPMQNARRWAALPGLRTNSANRLQSTMRPASR